MKLFGVTFSLYFFLAFTCLIIFMWFICFESGCKHKDRTFVVKVAADADRQDPPVISLYYTPGLHEDFEENVILPSVILAVWANGDIIWSKNPIKGGAPYFKGQCAPAKIDKTLEELKTSGAFEDITFNHPIYGPDSSFVTIAIYRGLDRLNMESWHEIVEMDPNLAATKQGVIKVQLERRANIFAQQPEIYQRYRKMWKRIREAIMTLLPHEGKPLNVTFEIRCY